MKNKTLGPGEMVQQLRPHPAPPENLSLVSPRSAAHSYLNLQLNLKTENHNSKTLAFPISPVWLSLKPLFPKGEASVGPRAAYGAKGRCGLVLSLKRDAWVGRTSWGQRLP